MKNNPLQFLPVNLFGAVMSFAGLSSAFVVFNQMIGIKTVLPDIFGIIAIAIFIILSIAYAIKTTMYPKKIYSECSNQIVVNFYGTITIAILLVSNVIRNYNFFIGQIVWWIGVISTLIMGYSIISKFIKEETPYSSVVPAWLIGGVASLDIAATSPNINETLINKIFINEVNLIGISVGTGLAIIFFILILHRLINHTPIPLPAKPSLMILIAPFAVGFLAYINYNGKIDTFASIMFYFSLFLFFVLVPQIFKKEHSFSVNWWAIGFPVAALTNASFKYAIFKDILALKVLSVALIIFLTIALTVLLIKTLISLFNGTLLK